MEENNKFLFTKNNYKFFFISLSLLCIGFLLMIGGGGTGISDFNPEIFSVQRIVIAPIVILVGYMGMVVSIFYND